MKKKYIEVKWVEEKAFGYGKAMRVIKSNHPKYVIGSRFDYGFMEVVIEEGYEVKVNPVPKQLVNV